MSKQQKWHEGLPEINWKSPEYIIKVNQVLNAQPVSYLDESQIELPQTGNKTEIVQWASKLFEMQGGYALHPVIGKVTLNRSSAKDSIAHGAINKYKTMAFKTVKDVIENGIIVAVDDARDNQRSYFISAPIFITAKEHTGERIATVTVHKDVNIQKMYLHSVIEKENLLMPRPYRAEESQRTSRKHSVSLTSTDIHNLLHSALIVNTKQALEQHYHASQQQEIPLIDLRGLCPREAGRKLFTATQGNLAQWALIERSAAAVGMTVDKKALEAAQGKAPLVMQEVMMKAITLKSKAITNGKSKTTDRERQ